MAALASPIAIYFLFEFHWLYRSTMTSAPSPSAKPIKMSKFGLRMNPDGKD
jgi:hypothetical protein